MGRVSEAEDVEAVVTAAGALQHQVEDEFHSFNPHLHYGQDGQEEDEENQWLVYGILMPVFGGMGILLNTFVFVTLR